MRVIQTSIYRLTSIVSQAGLQVILLWYMRLLVGGGVAGGEFSLSSLMMATNLRKCESCSSVASLRRFTVGAV